MGLGVDVGVDAQADRRDVAARRATSASTLELGVALDVEAAGCRRRAHGASRRASCRRPRRRPRRIAAGRQHALELAARDDVEAAAGARERLQHGQVGVGLHRVADQVVAPGERALVGGERRQHGAARIDVQRRADGVAPGRRARSRRARARRRGSATGGAPGSVIARAAGRMQRLRAAGWPRRADASGRGAPSAEAAASAPRPRARHVTTRLLGRTAAWRAATGNRPRGGPLHSIDCLHHPPNSSDHARSPLLPGRSPTPSTTRCDRRAGAHRSDRSTLAAERRGRHRRPAHRRPARD